MDARRSRDEGSAHGAFGAPYERPYTDAHAGFDVAAFSLRLLESFHYETYRLLSYYLCAQRPEPLIIDGGSNIGMSVLFFPARVCLRASPPSNRPRRQAFISHRGFLAIDTAQRSCSLYADSRMRLRYYGQNGEDAILWRFFHKPHGFYVDIGAFDGKYLSNSLIFERSGWHGICVEAHPQYAELCRQNRPRATVVNKAVVADNRDTVELVADQTGLFTGQTPDMETVERWFRACDFPDPQWETIEIEATTLEKLLGRCPPIDFLSLDIEGGETDVLLTIDFELHRPRVLLLEANTAEELEALEETLALVGYRVARSMLWNHFFCAEADVARLRDVRAVAWLQRPAHPVRPELSAIGYPGRQLRCV
jgi:FkbM family methyltransferase